MSQLALSALFEYLHVCYGCNCFPYEKITIINYFQKVQLKHRMPNVIKIPVVMDVEEKVMFLLLQ